MSCDIIEKYHELEGRGKKRTCCAVLPRLSPTLGGSCGKAGSQLLEEGAASNLQLLPASTTREGRGDLPEEVSSTSK